MHHGRTMEQGQSRQLKQDFKGNQAILSWTTPVTGHAK